MNTLRTRPSNILRRLLGGVVLAAFAVTASAGDIFASSSLLEGLKHKETQAQTLNVSGEIHAWVGPSAHFVLRSQSITHQDTEFDGTVGMHMDELEAMAKGLARSTVQSAGPDQSINGPYGNFRVRTFTGSNQRYCVALRSFDGLNQSNADQYDGFDGRFQPMGFERVDGVLCRTGAELSDSDVRELISSIR